MGVNDLGLVAVQREDLADEDADALVTVFVENQHGRAQFSGRGHFHPAAWAAHTHS